MNITYKGECSLVEVNYPTFFMDTLVVWEHMWK